MIESRKRSIAKAMSWRIFSALCTVTITWAVTGSVGAAISVGCIDFFIKLAIYYGHERLWQRIAWGTPKGTVESGGGI